MRGTPIRSSATDSGARSKTPEAWEIRVAVAAKKRPTISVMATPRLDITYEGVSVHIGGATGGHGHDDNEAGNESQQRHRSHIAPRGAGVIEDSPSGQQPRDPCRARAGTCNKLQQPGAHKIDGTDDDGEEGHDGHKAHERADVGKAEETAPRHPA